MFNLKPRLKQTLLILGAVLVTLAACAAGASAADLPAPPDAPAARDATPSVLSEDDVAAAVAPKKLARQPLTLADAVATGKLEPKVLRQLEAHGTVDVIVSVDDDAALRSAAARAPKGKERAATILDDVKPTVDAKKDHALAALGKRGKLVRDFSVLPASVMRIDSAAGLLDLVRSPDVSHVGANDVNRPTLAQSLPQIRQGAAASAGYKGAGTYVAVLDTGIDYTNPAFGSCTAPNTPSTCRVASSWDAAPNDYSLDDDDHGTNVSGIVAGVAPGTRLLVVDVFEANLLGEQGADDQVILDAIDWVLDQKRAGVNVRAINLSLGSGDYNTSACTSDYTNTFQTARALKVLPVVAAGNDADHGYGFTNGISSPACTAGAVSVGAVYDADVGAKSYRSGCSDDTTAVDKITCFSQSGPEPHDARPRRDHHGGRDHAAGHLAGGPACRRRGRRAGGREPRASIDQVQASLAGTGKAIYDARNGVTKRRLDLYSAVTSVVGDTVAPTVTTPVQTIASATTAKVTWSGSDNLTGIKQYSVMEWREESCGVGCDSSHWVTVAPASATSTSVVLPVMDGKLHAYAVRATDGAGNSSGWAVGPGFRASTIQSGITFTGNWRTTSGTCTSADRPVGPTSPATARDSRSPATTSPGSARSARMEERQTSCWMTPTGRAAR